MESKYFAYTLCVKIQENPVFGTGESREGIYPTHMYFKDIDTILSDMKEKSKYINQIISNIVFTHATIPITAAPCLLVYGVSYDITIGIEKVGCIKGSINGELEFIQN